MNVGCVGTSLYSDPRGSIPQMHGTVACVEGIHNVEEICEEVQAPLCELRLP